MTAGNFVTNVGLLCGRTPSCYGAKLPWSTTSSIAQRTEPVSYGSFALLAAVLHCAVSVVIAVTTVENDKEAASDDDDDDVVDGNEDVQGNTRDDGAHSYGNDGGRKRLHQSRDYDTTADCELDDREKQSAEVPFNHFDQSRQIAGSSSSSSRSSSSSSRGTMSSRDPTATQLLTALRTMGSTRHARTLGFLLIFGRVAFALVESGTLPAVEFVRAGGQLSSLACVTALQMPMQAILSIVIVQRLTPSSSSLQSPSSSLKSTSSSHPNSDGLPSSLKSNDSSSGFNSSLTVWRQAHVGLLGLAMLTPLVTELVASLVAPTCSNVSRWAGTVFPTYMFFALFFSFLEHESSSSYLQVNSFVASFPSLIFLLHSCLSWFLCVHLCGIFRSSSVLFFA